MTGRRRAFLTVLAAGMIALSGGLAGTLAPAHAAQQALRVGYFPNITHGQAVLGFGTGVFARKLPGIDVQGKVFNAGPDEMNALFAGAIDIGYVGPGPAINAYVKSGGGLQIVAGASTGGMLLVARAHSGIATVRDLSGRAVAVPQLGNTQDIVLRALLKDNHLLPTENGGSVRIIAVANPDTLTLFKKGALDAALVPEPWGSRLIAQTGASVVLDAKQIFGGAVPGAVVIVATPFLKAHRDLVVKFLRVHDQLTHQLSDSAAVQAALNAQIKVLTGKALPSGVLKAALGRTTFNTSIDQAALNRFAIFSVNAGYLKPSASIAGLVDHWALDHLSDASIK